MTRNKIRSITSGQYFDSFFQKIAEPTGSKSINPLPNKNMQICQNEIRLSTIQMSFNRMDWLIEWCCMPLLTVFQSHHSDSSPYSCLSWVSPVLG